MQSREIEENNNKSAALSSASINTQLKRDEELRQYEIHQLREKAYYADKNAANMTTVLRLSGIPVAAGVALGGLGGAAVPIWIAASGNAPRGHLSHMGAAIEGGGIFGMVAGGAAGVPITAAVAGISYGLAAMADYTMRSNLNKAKQIEAASGLISTSEKVSKKDILVNKLIAEINAIKDMPSLIEKVKDICDNDAEALRTERGIYSVSLFKNCVGDKLGHQDGNTRSWNKIKEELRRRSFVLSAVNDIRTAFQPIAALLDSVENGQRREHAARPV